MAAIRRRNVTTLNQVGQEPASQSVICALAISRFKWTNQRLNTEYTIDNARTSQLSLRSRLWLTHDSERVKTSAVNVQIDQSTINVTCTRDHLRHSKTYLTCKTLVRIPRHWEVAKGWPTTQIIGTQAPNSASQGRLGLTKWYCNLSNERLFFHWYEISLRCWTQLHIFTLNKQELG